MRMDFRRRWADFVAAWTPTKFGKRVLAYAMLLAAAYTPAILGVDIILHSRLSGVRVEDKKAKPVIGRAISIESQRSSSLHEAGHAIVTAYLMGSDTVGDIVLWTAVDKENLAGTVNWGTGVSKYTAQDYIELAAAYLAGRAADKLLQGQADIGAENDLGNANEELMYMRLNTGLGGALVIRPVATQADYDAVAEQLLMANVCAESLVIANEKNIREFAELLMDAPPHENKRVVSALAFREFLKTHVLQPPSANVSLIEIGDIDPCYFSVEP